MKYLVLHTFRSFGRTLHKGEVVDESAIRSLRLRLAERKVVPAVEEPTESAVISSGAPVQQVVAAPVEQAAPTIEAAAEQVETPEDDEQVETPEDKKQLKSRKEDVKPVRLSFGH